MDSLLQSLKRSTCERSMLRDCKPARTVAYSGDDGCIRDYAK